MSRVHVIYIYASSLSGAFFYVTQGATPNQFLALPKELGSGVFLVMNYEFIFAQKLNVITINPLRSLLNSIKGLAKLIPKVSFFG